MNFFKQRHLTIRSQLLFLTFAFSLTIGIIISAASYYAYSSYLKENLIHSTDTNLLFLSDYIDSELDNIDQLVTYCQQNTDIGKFVESKVIDSKNKMDAYEALSDYCMNNASSDYLERVVISNLAESYIQVVPASNSSTINIAQELPKQEFYNTLLDKDYVDYNVGFMIDMFHPGKGNTVVPLLRPITYKFSSHLGGYIFIQVNANLFSDAMSNTYQEEIGELYLTLGNHSYLYENGTFTPAKSTFRSESDGTTINGRPNARVSVITRQDGSEYYVITEELSHSNCYVSQMIPMEYVYSGWSLFYLLILFLFVLLFFISILLNHFLGKIITTPVRQIQSRLIQIADGDFSRDTSIEWEHELGDIGKGVNELAANIEELLKTTLEDEKQKRDLEYKVLQSQINPHFLYNTLNSIKWMASIQGATGITDMTTALSRLLKSISKGTKLLIPLSEELSLLQDYFTIQQYRYGGTVTMQTFVEDDTLKDCHIIKFTLQPLVENAIFHGIEPKGLPGKITVHLFSVSDTDMQIDIIDNGVGMTEEVMARILSDNTVNTSDFFKELGVSNVHQRLQYEYGTEYGISISSKLGEYTKMTIRIPKQFHATK